MPIYTKTDNNEYTLQNIAGNFISTKKITDLKEEKTIKIFNFSIGKTTLQDNIYKCYLFNLLIKQTHLADIFFKNRLKKLNFEYDDIYLLHSNSGEMFLFFAYLVKLFLQKNNSKNPLFIATKKYHIDLLNMYLPEAKYIFINNLKLKTQTDTWNFNGHKVYILFSHNYYDKIESDIKNCETGSAHYFQNMLEALNISEINLMNNKIQITSDTKETMNTKISKTKLNRNNFIIIPGSKR